MWECEGIVKNRYLLVRSSDPRYADGPIIAIWERDEEELAAVKDAGCIFVGEVHSHLTPKELKAGLNYCIRGRDCTIAQRWRFKQNKLNRNIDLEV